MTSEPQALYERIRTFQFDDGPEKMGTITARRMSSWRRLPAAMKLGLTAVRVVGHLALIGCTGGLASEHQ